MDCATPGGTESRGIFLLLAAALLAAGCSSPPVKPFPNHMRGIRSAGGNAAFEQILRAAKQVEAEAAKVINRTTWTPGLRRVAQQRSANGLHTLRTALTARPNFAFTARPPDASRPGVRGWAFLAQVLAWRIEDAPESGDGAAAVADFLTCARFANALKKGDCLDAGLGISAARNAMTPLWQGLAKFSPGELMSLYAGISSALRAAPPDEATLRREHETMRRSVQWVQDLFRQGKLARVRTALGVQVDATVRYLRELQGKAQNEQVEFFAGFARECDAEADWLLAQSRLPPHRRAEPPKLEGERPWRRLSAALFRTGRVHLEGASEYGARLKLLAVDAWLLAQFKSTRSVPKDLSALPKWLRTDPFSGRDFVYAPQGVDYRLYSIGANLLDDGGEPSETRMEGDYTPLR